MLKSDDTIHEKILSTERCSLEETQNCSLKDTVAKKAHLKIQREKKRLYRDCKIEESCNVATACFSSSNSSFSGTAVNSRSLSKAANALPKSLHKHSEIVQSLSNKFNLRINFTKRKPDQPENELCEDESSVERPALYW